MKKWENTILSKKNLGKSVFHKTKRSKEFAILMVPNHCTNVVESMLIV